MKMALPDLEELDFWGPALLEQLAVEVGEEKEKEKKKRTMKEREEGANGSAERKAGQEERKRATSSI